MNKCFLVLILFLNMPKAHATASQISAPYHCDFPGLQSISIPIYPDRKDSQKFTYRYQIVGEIKPNELAVIYLPGGPGENSIRNNSSPENEDYLNYELPKGLTRIFFDPRDVGCNHNIDSGLPFPDDSLTTHYLAEDVVAVINALGLKKYLLYGFSYGSQWATLVAGKTALGEAQNPQAVILGGVLGIGRADGSMSLGLNFIKQWQLIKPSLSTHVKEVLSGDLPMGVAPSRWGKLIRIGLKRGVRVIENKVRNDLFDTLHLIDSADPKDLETLKNRLNGYAPVSSAGDSEFDFSEHLFAKVDCHEFSPRDSVPIFEHGELVLDPTDNCLSESFDRPYDSAQFQISAPIYYLAGENDPSAPFEGAWYHFQNQHLSQKNFIQIPGGGHSTMGDLFPDCQDEIWDSIREGQDLKTVINHCMLRAKVITKSADHS